MSPAASPARAVTIYDIAKVLKLSPSTVSRGLQNHAEIKKATIERIVSTAESLGYRSNPYASNFRKGRTNTIGVIIPRLNSNLASDVISGMECIASTHNYQLLISQSLDSDTREYLCIESMFGKRVDGLLVSLANNSQSGHLLASGAEKKVPIVFFDHAPELRDRPMVGIDHQAAARELTSHLLDQGCSSIVMVIDAKPGKSGTERVLGYKAALESRGLAFRPGQVIPADGSPRSGALIAESLANGSLSADGVLINGDPCGLACMRRARQLGLDIPGTLSFAGFSGELPPAVFEPGLTSVDWNGFELGRQAMERLIADIRIGPGGQKESLVLQHQLVVRESSRRVCMPMAV
jgi:LacI family transcriptional regulator